jgi:hypothetical protein
VPEGRYSDLVARLRPEAAVPGDIVDLERPDRRPPFRRDPLHDRPAPRTLPRRQEADRRAAIRRANRRRPRRDRRRPARRACQRDHRAPRRELDRAGAGPGSRRKPGAKSPSGCARRVRRRRRCSNIRQGAHASAFLAKRAASPRGRPASSMSRPRRRRASSAAASS